jgi:Flp pilus assembly protein TadB
MSPNLNGTSAYLPVNPLFSIFLFAMSLLAIAAACALLMYIANEMQHNRRVAEEEERHEEAVQTEAKEISQFLSKMKASTLIGASKQRKKIDSDYDKN